MINTAIEKRQIENKQAQLFASVSTSALQDVKDGRTYRFLKAIPKKPKDTEKKSTEKSTVHVAWWIVFGSQCEFFARTVSTILDSGVRAPNALTAVQLWLSDDLKRFNMPLTGNEYANKIQRIINSVLQSQLDTVFFSGDRLLTAATMTDTESFRGLFEYNFSADVVETATKKFRQIGKPYKTELTKLLSQTYLENNRKKFQTCGFRIEIEIDRYVHSVRRQEQFRLREIRREEEIAQKELKRLEAEAKRKERHQQQEESLAKRKPRIFSTIERQERVAKEKKRMGINEKSKKNTTDRTGRTGKRTTGSYTVERTIGSHTTEIHSGSNR